MNVETAARATDFRSFARPERLGKGPAWLDEVREAAIERFHQHGFPSPKIESWKFTNLNPLARTTFRDAEVIKGLELTRAALEPYRLTPDCHLIVFVNGQFRSDLSALDHVPDGTRIVEFAAANEEDLRALTVPPAVAVDPKARSLMDLNTACMSGGAVVHLGRGAILDPVQLLFVAVAGAEPSPSTCAI